MTLQDAVSHTGGEAGKSALETAGTVALLIAGITALAWVILTLWRSGQNEAKEARAERDKLLTTLADEGKRCDADKARVALEHQAEISRIRSDYEARIRDQQVLHAKELAEEVRARLAASERSEDRLHGLGEKTVAAVQGLGVTMVKIEERIEPVRSR